MDHMQNQDLFKLDERTQSRLRSTQILTSLPQIVAELVQNSIDAGAKHIDIGVDNEEWACWVRDDGKGINRDGLSLIAREGGRYATSKAYDPSSLDNVTTFGFRGEALASAADVSCLEISSRTSRLGESRSIILKGGQKLYDGPSMRWRREAPGTTVSVRDAFFNLPIRRLSHPNPSRTIDLIKRDLEAYALAFPQVSFTFEDTAKERLVGSGKGRILTIAKTANTLAAFRKLFGKALVEHVEEINEESNGITLKGFLSLDGAHSKAYQYIFVNGHLMDTCDLHRALDKEFNFSSFAKHAYDEIGKISSPRPATRRSPRKVEKKPVYVLMLQVPPKQVDNCLEPAKTAVRFQNEDVVTDLLVTTVNTFLVKHGFKSASHGKGKGRGRIPSESPSPLKKRKIMEITNELPADAEELSYRPSTSKHFSERLRAAPEMARDEPVVEIGNPIMDGNDEEMEWHDPRTGRTYMVNTRTGNSYLKGRDTRGRLDDDQLLESKHFQDGGTSSGRVIVDTRSLRKTGVNGKDRNENGEDEDEMPEWIRDALQNNTAFAVTEKAIPMANAAATAATAASKNQRYRTDTPKDGPHHGKHQHVDRQTIDQYFRSSNLFPVPSGSLTREDLRNARVIEQVDRKFVACLVEVQKVRHTDGEDDVVMGGDSESDEGSDGRMSSGKTLLLIDQHAADERIRVERFFKELCGGAVEVREVDPAKPVLLTTAEKRTLMGSGSCIQAFRKWGIYFLEEEDEEKEEEEEGYTQVYVTGVPEVVADKLLAGEELREVIKGYLARLRTEDVDHMLSISHNEDDPTQWLKGLRWCPQELVNLVNSRACRGAIMFNDSLNLEQCNRLIQQLATTAFPFQCAHGRPSLIPLAHVEPRSSEERRIEWGNLTDEHAVY